MNAMQRTRRFADAAAVAFGAYFKVRSYRAKRAIIDAGSAFNALASVDDGSSGGISKSADYVFQIEIVHIDSLS